MADRISRRRFLSGTGAVLSVGLVGCLETNFVEGTDPNGSPRQDQVSQGETAWPQKGYDSGHSGVTTATGVPMAGDVDWHISNKRTGDPVVAADKVFYCDHLEGDSDDTRRVVCRDASTGRVKWVQPIGAVGTPIVAEGTS